MTPQEWRDKTIKDLEAKRKRTLVWDIDSKKIDKAKEYTFIEALAKIIHSNNLIITSKISGYSYKIYKSEMKNKLKFYNPVIAGWQLCTYILPEEIFDMWYVTAE